jgi:transcriptional regulator with XRE-family HTH domain
VSTPEWTNPDPLIYPIQIRAARGLLGMSQEELAARAELGVVTIKRLEAAGEEIRGSAKTTARIQRALEAAGIIFIDQDGANGPGVRLRNPLP